MGSLVKVLEIKVIVKDFWWFCNGNGDNLKYKLMDKDRIRNN